MTTVHIEQVDGITFVSGNTYPYRTELKSLGLRWNWTAKRWETTNQSMELMEDLRILLGSAYADGPGPPPAARKPGRRDDPVEVDVVLEGMGDEDDDDYVIPVVRPYKRQPPAARAQTIAHRAHLQQPQQPQYVALPPQRPPVYPTRAYAATPRVNLEIDCPWEPRESTTPSWYYNNNQ